MLAQRMGQLALEERRHARRLFGMVQQTRSMWPSLVRGSWAGVCGLAVHLRHRSRAHVFDGWVPFLALRGLLRGFLGLRGIRGGSTAAEFVSSGRCGALGIDEESSVKNGDCLSALGFLSGMGDTIRKAGVFLRTAREILRHRNDERSRCPRCRGSGLLNLLSNRRQGQPTPSTAPCFFCEGIGVVPTVGLRGYIFAQTDAMVRTKEMKTHPTAPELLHVESLHGCKSTRFSTRRHFKISPQVLYNPLSKPAWGLEAEREAVLMKLSQIATVEHSFDRRNCDDTWPVGLIGLDHAGWRHRHRFYARTSGSFSNLNNSQAGDLLPNIPPRAKDGQAGSGQLHSDGANFKEAAAQVADADSLGNGYSNLQERNKYVMSTRGHRSSRRLRNRVREEARKETEARARKVQNLQIQASDTSASSWNPLLWMCRSVLLRRTSSA